MTDTCLTSDPHTLTPIIWRAESAYTHTEQQISLCVSAIFYPYLMLDNLQEIWLKKKKNKKNTALSVITYKVSQLSADNIREYTWSSNYPSDATFP